jgi:hypothetical protein
MKRAAAFLTLCLAGCSTAPCADILDFFKPGKLEPGQYYGGVCGPACLQPAPPLADAPASAPPPIVMPPPLAVPPIPSPGTPAAPVMPPATSLGPPATPAG